jgi:Tol biopolymer transport system component
VASPTPSFPTSELVTVNRSGQITPLAAPATGYKERIEISPQGARIAVSVQTTKNVRLVLYDLVRGTLTPAFAESVDREVTRPVWSSDGKIAVHVIHVMEGPRSHVEVFNPDHPTPPEAVSDSAGFFPSSWSPDGERLVGSKAGDLWVYSPYDKGSKWTRLTATDAIEGFPVWSPDGHQLAYVSNVSGRDEVYVQQYPVPGTAIPISTSGGRGPMWNPRGRELFYVEPHPGEKDDWRMMSVEMAAPLQPGRPMPLFWFSSDSLLLALCNPTACYSVASDGQKFFTLRMLPRQPARVTEIRLILNWHEELKRLVPPK